MEEWSTRILIFNVSAQPKSSEEEFAVENILHEHISSFDSGDIISAEVISSPYHVVVQDEHSYTKDHSEISEILVPKGRPKKGRKRKHEQQSRSDRKKLKNSNIEHYNTKDVKVLSKPFLDFDCQCSMACAVVLNAEIRRQEYENFWQLGDYTAQNAYIAGLVSEYPVKRKYGKSVTSKTRNTAIEDMNNIAEDDKAVVSESINKSKSENSKIKDKHFSRKYHLKSTEVCRLMFCKTLNISSSRVNTALKKMHGRAPLLDLRGLKSGGQNKLSPERTQAAIEQIRKITTYVNGCHKHLPKSRYLPPEMTLEKMYNAYKTVNENPISLSSYKKLFYEHFNFKFKTLKAETAKDGVGYTTEDLVQIMNKARVENEIVVEEVEVSEDVKGRPKKGRKRLHPEQSRSDRKKLKNRNVEHYNSKNVKVEAKAFIDFDCRCSMECATKLSSDNRKEEYEKFWQLGDYTSQNAYISALVSEYPVKRKFKKKSSVEEEVISGAKTKDKQFSRKYRLKDVEVCRILFCKTLNISSSRVNTALKKMHGRAPLLDLRGLKQGGSNKLSEERTKEALLHIQNVLISCNLSCDRNCTQYLPPEVNLVKMYQFYKHASSEPISFSSYKKIFYENFNFKCKPKGKKEVSK